MNVKPGFRIAVWTASVAIAVSCSSAETADSSGTDAPSSSSESVPNPGSVFEGTYEAKQVQEERPDLAPTPAEYQTSVFSVKSFCANESGPCVASALVTYPDFVPPPAPQPVVLDFVDGRWIANLALPSFSCSTVSGTPLQASGWQVSSFEQADGVDDGSLMTGTGVTHAGPPCLKEYSTAYTFTRTGPLDPAMVIPSPDELPPLVDSPGSALSGTYDLDLTPLPEPGNLNAQQVTESGNYQSSCTRTGDRCVSILDAETDILPTLEWADGTWSSDATYASAPCEDGSGQQQTTIRVSLTNNDASTSPAQALTGEVRKTYAGDCPGEVAWTIAATRTGD